jgi:O-antigen/teichoic acid export membrane protein
MRSLSSAGIATMVWGLSDTPTSEPISARNPLPEGTLAVGAGLVISGICAYAFTALAGKALPDSDVIILQALWFATFAIAPGFFLPLEQELGRALSHRKTLGQGGRPVVERAVLLGGSIAALVVIALVLLRPVLTKHSFHDNGTVVWALILSVVTWGAAHIGRGILSGSGRFRPYGMIMGIDGLVRVAGCGVLAAMGVKSLIAYALLVGLPPILALLISFVPQRNLLQPGPEAPWVEVTTNIGWLLLGSVAAAFLVNAGPLIAGPLASALDKEPSASFSSTTKLYSRLAAFNFAILISRIPLFMFQAVQASLLPKLARLAAIGAFDEFRRGFRTLMKVVAAVAVIGVVGAGVLGPLALSIAFKVKVNSSDMALLALAAGLYMAAVAIAQALIALHRHPTVAVGWVLGVIAVFAMLPLASDLLPRVEAALIAASVVPLIFFAVMLRQTLSHPSKIDTSAEAEILLP